MITPDPVLMTNESGRTFEFVLGRFEKKSSNEASTGQLGSQDDVTVEESEPKWVPYKFNQQIATLVSLNTTLILMQRQNINTVEGVCRVSSIEYALDETFRGGSYEIVIRDVTVGIPPHKQLSETKIELLIIDPEELAAQQAALAAQAKGPPKKK